MRWWLLPHAFAVAVGCAPGSGRTPATLEATPPQVAPADATAAAPPLPPQPPPPLDRDPPRFAARAVAALQAVASAVAGADCADATAKLDAMHDDFADYYAASVALRAGRVADLRAALALRQGDVDTAGAAIVAGAAMTACQHDAAFQRAFERAMGGR